MRKLSQKRLQKRIVKELSKIDDLKAIILYGSMARGDYTAKSDIDLLILTTKSETSFEIQDRVISLELEKNIQPTIRTLNELKQTDSGLVQNILLEGKILYLEEPIDIDARLLLELNPNIISSFNLSHLDQKTKAKFNRELYQRKSKKYDYEGILRKIGGRKISSGCILFANDKKKTIDKFFKKYKIDAEMIKVWK